MDARRPFPYYQTVDVWKSSDVTNRIVVAVDDDSRVWRAIINTIPTLSWSTSPDGSVEFLSERWLGFTGLTEEESKDMRPSHSHRYAREHLRLTGSCLVAGWELARLSGPWVEVEVARWQGGARSGIPPRCGSDRFFSR